MPMREHGYSSSWEIAAQIDSFRKRLSDQMRALWRRSLRSLFITANNVQAQPKRLLCGQLKM